MSIASAHEKVTLPVSRHSAVLDFGGAFTDRDCVQNLPLSRRLPLRRLSKPTSCSEVLDELSFEYAARLDEQRAINGLVRDMHRLICWIPALQPPCNLFRRPVLLELGCHHAPQAAVRCQLARLRSFCGVPRALLCSDGPIASSAAISGDLSTNRTRRAPKL